MHTYILKSDRLYQGLCVTIWIIIIFEVTMFSKFYNISSKTLGIVLLSSIPFCANAQDNKSTTPAPATSAATAPASTTSTAATAPAATPTITSPAAPAMPVAPKDTPIDPTAPTAMPTATDPAAATVPATGTTATTPDGSPSLLISPAPTVPAADNTLIDKAVAAMNTNNVDDFVTIFDNSNFLFITMKGDKVTTLPELKVQWGTMFGTTGELKGFKASLTPGKVMELAPGAASFDGSIVFTTPENKTVRAIISGAMKYSDSTWKVNTMHISSNDLVKMQSEAEFQKNKGGSSGTLMSVLLGFALGVVGMLYFVRSKKAKQQQQ